MIARRTLFQAAAATLAAPAIGQDSRASTLRFVPQANLTVLDPIVTTATVTGNHGFYVFDTLYGVDDKLNPKPQMVEGHEVLEDGKRWRFRLREGLSWHDNTPVRSVDCLASLRRWCARDPFGQLLARAVVEWIAVDDRHFELRLSRPFPLLLSALAKPDASTCFMMPERIASADPMRAVTEMVGSGPYRFLAGEYNSGSRAVYEKFAGYKPRGEAPSWTSGGKLAQFQRIEWHILPDPATAAAALQSGEVDWWERPHPDLLPLLARSRDVKLEVTDAAGRMAIMRLNHLQPPFDDVRLRRAVRLLVKQEDYMRASRGDDRDAWMTCRSLWPRHTPYYEDVGDAVMPGSIDAAKSALRDAGYAGQKAVIINPTDFPDIGPLGQVSNDLMKRAGFNTELAESDWGTVVQRRNSREPVDKGGWSIFHTTGSATAWASPALSNLVRGNGAAGWFGWWTSARAEELAETWLYETDAAKQRSLASELGKLALDEVATIPLGQFVLKTAYRRNLTGMLQGPVPFPWGLRRG